MRSGAYQFHDLLHLGIAHNYLDEVPAVKSNILLRVKVVVIMLRAGAMAQDFHHGDAGKIRLRLQQAEDAREKAVLYIGFDFFHR